MKALDKFNYSIATGLLAVWCYNNIVNPYVSIWLTLWWTSVTILTVFKGKSTPFE